ARLMSCMPPFPTEATSKHPAALASTAAVANNKPTPLVSGHGRPESAWSPFISFSQKGQAPGGQTDSEAPTCRPCLRLGNYGTPNCGRLADAMIRLLTGPRDRDAHHGDLGARWPASRV